MVAAGTPIRLIHENGDFTELDATSITLETVRKANSSSIPFGGGGRWNFDLNLQNAEIMIDGIFTDDNTTFGGTEAFATFNCLNTKPITFIGGIKWLYKTNLNKVFGAVNVNNNLTNGNNITTANSAIITLKNSAGIDKYIPLVRRTYTNDDDFADIYAVNSNNIRGLSGVTKYIGISYPNSDQSSAQETANAQVLATQIKEYVDTVLSGDFSASIQDDDNFIFDDENVVVKFTQKSVGVAGNNSKPIFDLVQNGTGRKPDIVSFRGGVNSKKKSAGDKVQDFYGIINNSRRTRGKKDTFLSSYKLDNPFDLDFNGGFRRPAVNSGDYIVGVQIPFNSMINAGNGTYVARNFHMPTGRNKSPEDKGAEAAMVTGTNFSETDKSTGIQGFVKKFSVDYDAGETVYKFKMVFLPVDWMF